MSRVAPSIGRLVAVAAIALICISCTAAADEPAQEPISVPIPETLASVDELVIGFAGQSDEWAFSKSLLDGATEAADAAGVTLMVANAGGSASRQSDRVDELLEAGVDAIMLSPIDSAQATAIADRVIAAGVPLLAVSNQIGTVKMYGAQYVYPGTVGLVANDDLHMGRVAAGFVQEPIGANIAVLQGNPAAANSNLRLAGFTSALDALGVEYRIVARLTGHWDRERAASACEVFTRLDDVDLVFAMSDDMTAACVRTFHEAQNLDTRFISLGGSRPLSMLTLDFVLGTVCQSPKQMGQLAVDTLVDAFETGEFDQGLRIGLADEVTRSSLADCSSGW